MPDTESSDVRDKIEKLNALLTGIDDEEVAEELIDMRADIEDDLTYFVEADGDLALLRDVFASYSSEALCECADPLCPPKQGQVPVRVQTSSMSTPKALQAWESEHEGAHVYQRYVEERVTKLQRVNRQLGRAISKARTARKEAQEA